MCIQGKLLSLNSDPNVFQQLMSKCISLVIHEKDTKDSGLWKLLLGLSVAEIMSFFDDLSGKMCREVAVQRGGLLWMVWAALGVPGSSVTMG